MSYFVSEIMPILLTILAIILHSTANTRGRFTGTFSNQKQENINNSARIVRCKTCRYRRVAVIDIATLYGMRAQKMLLKDAKKVFSLGTDRVFEKKGGYTRAFKEFNDVKPNEVFEAVDHLSGVIGDRQIIMDRGRIGDRPRIYLIKWGPQELVGKQANRVMDTIIYKDK